MREPIIWAVVMNSESARFLRGLHRDGRTDAAEIELHNGHPRLQDLMSDKPGRSFSSVGHSRSALEYASDPVRDAQRAFLLRVIDRLETARAENDFDQLAVVASRPMLGMFRHEAPPSLARVVICEVAKNLLHLSPQQLSVKVALAIYQRPEGTMVT